MANIKGLIVEEDIVAQEFDLEDILDVDLSDAEDLVSEIGKDIVDYIKLRAESGKGIGGKQLRKPYSKAYADSEEFKAAGKSANDITMTLHGDMLSAIDVIDYDGQTLVVGIENDQAPKAHGHMTGKNGEVPKMKREFFGLTQAELKTITDKYRSRIDELKPAPTRVEDLLTPEENKAVDNAFRNIGDLFDFNEDE